jgi:ABC-type uncharacterized transport system involved in gliding motility auxiliary subunit
MKWDREETARFIATIGIAALIAGYVRYSYEGSLLRLSKILLISGGVLVVVGVVLGFQGIIGFFSRRSSQLGTNTTILALAVIAILGFLNFVGYRHHKRFDLTTEKLYTLSDQTKKIVTGLQTDVNVIRFAKTPDRMTNDLMTEYTDLNRHLKFQTVDPQQKPEVAQQYGAKRVGDVIVASGPRTEHLESSMGGGVSEEDLTSAILKVTREKQKSLCFVTGHGEKSVGDDPQSPYSQAATQLKKEGYRLKSINLVTENDVPPECDVLVIAGPTQAFFPQETAIVAKYLDAGGKALILLDAQTDPKLDDIFHAWNINVGNNVVIDASGMGRMLGAGPAIPLVTDFGPSPITQNFQGSMTFFPLARTVSIADKSKTVSQAIELLKTSPRSFTIPSLKETQKEVAYDPKTSTLGPLSLGVAASRKEGDRTARLVVIGNSTFATNELVTQQRNGDLFFNAINWLAQDENLISIRPKTATNRKVDMTEAQARAMSWLDLVFLPGFVILCGVYIWWKRR